MKDKDKTGLQVILDSTKLAMNASLSQEPNYYIKCNNHGLTNAWMQIKEDIFCMECIADSLKKKMKTYKIIERSEMKTYKSIEGSDFLKQDTDWSEDKMNDKKLGERCNRSLQNFINYFEGKKSQ